MTSLINRLKQANLARLWPIALLTALQACSTAPVQPQVVEEEIPAEKLPPEKVADRSFNTETLYALMVAEMAIDRKRYDIALNNYVQQAVSTRDPLVTARATQIARILKAHQPALEMAELWVDLEPHSTDAQLIATAELIEANRVEEAVTMSTRLLEAGSSTAFDSIAVKASEGDIEQVQKLSAKYAELLKTYPNEEQLLLGYSVLLQQEGKDAEALDAIGKALVLNPQNIRASFQETRILQQMGKQDLALEKLSNLVKENPDNFALRARYARVVSATDLNESREQFQTLLKQSPNDPEILFSLAIVEKESSRLEQAEQHFKDLLSMGYYRNSAHYHLGHIYEKQNDLDLAVEHYSQVEPSQNFLSAMVQVTSLLSNNNREIDALTLLREKRATAEGNYQEGLFILESDVLSTAGQMNAAKLVLSDALEAFPESTKLLYARAMLYTRIDYIDAAEQDLKKILAVTPDNAAALNALGYTLADRTDRIEEAYLYIKKAFELTPDDPAVIDSMGWVQYRRGNYEQALIRLRQAMKAMPDHEIAAHLGEVLWVTGGRDEAKEIWKQGLELKPQSDVIHKTLQRLQVTL